MEREENTEDSDDSEGGRGGAENDNYVEHIENANGDDADDEISDKKPSNKNEKRVYRWRKKEPTVFDTSFKEKEFNPPTENAAKMTSLQYLKLFCDNNILEHIAHHTNLYSVQQSGKSVKTNAKEIEVFFGTQMTMAIVKTSQYKMHWSSEFRYEPVVLAMTLKQCETLRKFLHVNVNDSQNNPKNSNDKLFNQGETIA